MIARTPAPPFQWIPGNGFDEEALGRLKAAFPRPKDAMGEAWFMGDERRTFDNLNGDLRTVSLSELTRALSEIASGTSSFGSMPEWFDWFHYLLAQLIPRSHEAWLERRLLQSLVTAFISQHPNGIANDLYRGFHSDALQTIGRCLMASTCWIGGRTFISNNPILDTGGASYRYGASGDFSASMFFCLKYLHDFQIEGWIKSIFDIPCAYWRAQLILWFVGAYEVLNENIQQPSRFGKNDYPDISWEGCHCLQGNYTGDYSRKIEAGHFLPEQNRLRALTAVGSFVTEDIFLSWLLGIAENENLEAGLGTVPDRFCELYLS